MKVEFSKYSDGLVPAIIQDDKTGKVLMLGFMNEDALKKTEELKKVTFYSRSKKRLWTKGEESGNFLELKSIASDCDDDTLLIKAHPLGPVCHTGAILVLMRKIKKIISYWYCRRSFVSDSNRHRVILMLPVCFKRA